MVPNMATIKTFDGKSKKGWFYQLNDSQIVLLDKGGKYPKTNSILMLTNLLRTFHSDRSDTIAVIA